MILPKKPRGGYLNISERERNVRVSSDRIFVENVFGRASSLFGMMTKKFVWNRDRFDSVIDVCFSLTNCHLRLHPMREDDVMYYQKALSGMAIRTEEVKSYARARQLKKSL